MALILTKPLANVTKVGDVLQVCYKLPLLSDATSLNCEVCESYIVLTDQSQVYDTLSIPLQNTLASSSLIAKFSKKRKELTVSLQLKKVIDHPSIHYSTSSSTPPPPPPPSPPPLMFKLDISKEDIGRPSPKQLLQHAQECLSPSSLQVYC